MQHHCLGCNTTTYHWHLHDTAHGIPETHMAGSERFQCKECKRTTFASLPTPARSRSCWTARHSGRLRHDRHRHRAIRLLDGPMVRCRSEKVKLMAADLVRFDAFRIEQDSIRALMANSRWSRSSFTATTPGRYAMQSVVAVEMSKP
jgi:hypothetical protein